MYIQWVMGLRDGQLIMSWLKSRPMLWIGIHLVMSSEPRYLCSTTELKWNFVYWERKENLPLNSYVWKTWHFFVSIVWQYLLSTISNIKVTQFTGFDIHSMTCQNHVHGQHQKTLQGKVRICSPKTYLPRPRLFQW